MTETILKERWLVSPEAPNQVLKAGQKNFVPLEKGVRYRVVPADTNGGTLKEDVEAIRDRQDLTVRYPDGTEIIVPDYYNTCAGGVCGLAIGDGTPAGYVLNPDAPASLLLGPQILDLTLPPVVLPEAAVAIAPIAPPQLVTVAPVEAAGGWGVWTWVGIGGGVALAAAAGGGGGGGTGSGGTGTGTGTGTGGDVVPPTLSSSTPADNATPISVGSDIVLRFSERVFVGSGNIVISNGTDTRTIAVTDSTQVTISGSTVIINPAADLQVNSDYYVQIASGVFTDAANNPFAGISSSTALNFGTQDIVPFLILSAPVDNAIAVLIGRDIVLTFSETVMAGSGNVVISNGTDTRTIDITDTSQVTINGHTVTINPVADLQSNSHYNVRMASGVVTDANGNPFAGITASTALDFDTQDLIAPTLSSSAPADNAIGELIGSNIVLTFSKTVIAGIGDIVISNGTDTRTISVTDTSQVTITGNTVTINPVADLQSSSHYSVQMASGVITDVVGNSFAGITSGTALDFFTPGIPASLSAIAAGSGGFVINGQASNDLSGRSVSAAGDVNGDGLADLIVGAPNSDPFAVSNAGRSYVVFGRTGSGAVNLSAVVAGVDGFVINGQAASDNNGISVSGAGDVNGDGLADLIVGADGSDVLTVGEAGRTYVVYGKTETSAVYLSAVASGVGGFVINGQRDGDYSGQSVSGAGDVNGDGRADIIVGASRAGTDYEGRSYVVFGKTGGGNVDLAAVETGAGGFVINGQSVGDQSGTSVSAAGDVNGDGLADLIVGAPGGDSSAATNVGRSYVVFGKTGTAAVNLSAVAAGVGGFAINGQADGDASGESVSGVGDINGDGLSDLIVGALYSGFHAGRSYVVFGKTGGSEIDLAVVATGAGGFAINGQSASDFSGWSVSGAGDLNGDGLNDLIVGAAASDPSGRGNAGRSYVIFGATTGVFSQTAVDQYGTSGSDSYTDAGTSQTLVTGLGDDTLTATAASILYGGAGSDLFVISDAMITALQGGMNDGGNTNQLARIDGGTGTDTLSLSGSGNMFDLTLIANQAGSNPDGGSRIDSIEKIDITGTGNNTLVLKLADVLDMGSANIFVMTGRQQLLVTGDAGDTVDLADLTGTATWMQTGTELIGAVTYNVWHHDTALATIYINPNLTVI